MGHTVHTTTVQLLAQAHCRESTEQAGINSSHKLLLCSADFIILEPPFEQIGANLDELGHIEANWGKLRCLGRIGANRGKLGQIKDNWGKLEQIGGIFGRIGANWSKMGQIGANWDKLGQIGANWGQIVADWDKLGQIFFGKKKIVLSHYNNNFTWILFL